MDAAHVGIVARADGAMLRAACSAALQQQLGEVATQMQQLQAVLDGLAARQPTSATATEQRSSPLHAVINELRHLQQGLRLKLAWMVHMTTVAPSWSSVRATPAVAAAAAEVFAAQTALCWEAASLAHAQPVRSFFTRMDEHVTPKVIELLVRLAMWPSAFVVGISTMDRAIQDLERATRLASVASSTIGRAMPYKRGEFAKTLLYEIERVQRHHPQLSKRFERYASRLVRGIARMDPKETAGGRLLRFAAELAEDEESASVLAKDQQWLFATMVKLVRPSSKELQKLLDATALDSIAGALEIFLRLVAQQRPMDMKKLKHLQESVDWSVPIVRIRLVKQYGSLKRLMCEAEGQPDGGLAGLKERAKVCLEEVRNAYNSEDKSSGTSLLSSSVTSELPVLVRETISWQSNLVGAVMADIMEALGMFTALSVGYSQTPKYSALSQLCQQFPHEALVHAIKSHIKVLAERSHPDGKEAALLHCATVAVRRLEDGDAVNPTRFHELYKLSLETLTTWIDQVQPIQLTEKRKSIITMLLQLCKAHPSPSAHVTTTFQLLLGEILEHFQSARPNDDELRAKLRTSVDTMKGRKTMASEREQQPEAVVKEATSNAEQSTNPSKASKELTKAEKLTAGVKQRAVYALELARQAFLRPDVVGLELLNGELYLKLTSLLRDMLCKKLRMDNISTALAMVCNACVVTVALMTSKIQERAKNADKRAHKLMLTLEKVRARHPSTTTRLQPCIDDLTDYSKKQTAEHRCQQLAQVTTGLDAIATPTFEALESMWREADREPLDSDKLCAVIAPLLDACEKCPFVEYTDVFLHPLLDHMTKIEALAAGDHTDALRDKVRADINVYRRRAHALLEPRQAVMEEETTETEPGEIQEDADDVPGNETTHSDMGPESSAIPVSEEHLEKSAAVVSDTASALHLQPSTESRTPETTPPTQSATEFVDKEHGIIRDAFQLIANLEKLNREERAQNLVPLLKVATRCVIGTSVDEDGTEAILLRTIDLFPRTSYINKPRTVLAHLKGLLQAIDRSSSGVRTRLARQRSLVYDQFNSVRAHIDLQLQRLSERAVGCLQLARSVFVGEKSRETADLADKLFRQIPDVIKEATSQWTQEQVRAVLEITFEVVELAVEIALSAQHERTKHWTRLASNVLQWITTLQMSCGYASDRLEKSAQAVTDYVHNVPYREVTEYRCARLAKEIERMPECARPARVNTLVDLAFEVLESIWRDNRSASLDKISVIPLVLSKLDPKMGRHRLDKIYTGLLRDVDRIWSRKSTDVEALRPALGRHRKRLQALCGKQAQAHVPVQTAAQLLAQRVHACYDAAQHAYAQRTPRCFELLDGPVLDHVFSLLSALPKMSWLQDTANVVGTVQAIMETVVKLGISSARVQTGSTLATLASLKRSVEDVRQRCVQFAHPLAWSSTQLEAFLADQHPVSKRLRRNW